MSKRSQKHMSRNVHTDTKMVDKQIKEIGGLKGINRLSPGAFTRKLLKKRKVESPVIIQRIKIAPGLWIVPKEPIKNEKEKQKFINQMKIKFNKL